MAAESPMVVKSLHILWNSLDGILMTASHCCSGIPKCSLSMSISFISYSDALSPFVLSKTNTTVSMLSSALILILSSLQAQSDNFCHGTNVQTEGDTSVTAVRIKAV